MDLTIFYSWQSDLPNAANRNFILTALERAGAELDRGDGTRTVIDRDTQNVAGAPDIAATIYEKIDRCDIFVADITPIGQAGPKSRWTPNPNVMLELGRASKQPGWDRMILVLNTHYARVEDLPFDLITRRVLPYTMDPAATERAAVRDDVSRKLTGALRVILEGRLRGEAAQLIAPEVRVAPEIRDEASVAALVPPRTLAAMDRLLGWNHTQEEIAFPIRLFSELQQRLILVGRPARELLGVVIGRAVVRWHGADPDVLLSELREATGRAKGLKDLLDILEQHGFVSRWYDDERRADFVALRKASHDWDTWPALAEYCAKAGLSLSQLLGDLDFSVLDEASPHQG